MEFNWLKVTGLDISHFPVFTLLAKTNGSLSRSTLDYCGAFKKCEKVSLCVNELFHLLMSLTSCPAPQVSGLHDISCLSTFYFTAPCASAIKFCSSEKAPRALQRPVKVPHATLANYLRWYVYHCQESC